MIRGITASTPSLRQTVRERLQLQRASRTGMQFTATLIGNPAGRAKRAMNVIRFIEKSVSLAQARKRRKAGTLGALRFKIRRAGGMQTIKGAFIGNNGRTVFRRTGKARLPIEAVSTIGVPQMFQARKVQLPVQRWITENFPRIFDREMRYFLRTSNDRLHGVKPAPPVIENAVRRAHQADFDRIIAEGIAEGERLDAAGELTDEAGERITQQAMQRIEAVCLAWARSLPRETVIYLDDYCQAYQEC